MLNRFMCYVAEVSSEVSSANKPAQACSASKPRC